MFFMICDLGVFFRGAELQVLGPGLGALEMAGRDVERITGLEHLLLAGDGEGHLPLEHIPPVRAVALVVGKAFEQRG
jgi:hypothetical protein